MCEYQLLAILSTSDNTSAKYPSPDIDKTTTCFSLIWKSIVLGYEWNGFKWDVCVLMSFGRVNGGLNDVFVSACVPSCGDQSAW